MLITMILMIFLSQQDKPPLAEKKGFELLIKKGVVKKARQEDLDNYFIYKEKCLNQKHSRQMIDANTYVVLKPMSYPLGLIGGNAPTLIISHGIPKPTGDSGQSDILDMNFNCDELLRERKKMYSDIFEHLPSEIRR